MFEICFIHKLQNSEGLTNKELKRNLKMTELTLKQQMVKQSKMSKYTRDLRCQLAKMKQKNIQLQTSFTMKRLELEDKISKLKHDLKNFMCDDDDFFVDPKTGIIDMTQSKTPKTPQKPKRKKTVRLGKCKRKLKM